MGNGSAWGQVPAQEVGFRLSLGPTPVYWSSFYAFGAQLCLSQGPFRALSSLPFLTILEVSG